ncbi:HI1450 family dsDNA-mimic protein [Photorhabdus hindustanensis]|uniref:Putative double-stranded DNA mimic protein C6H66_03055 n=1 Tax=Photorhabdus hindustanensis TaxID=2918802 RepID=A0A2S8Q7Q4_9GAMM|nr:HI1450 family dsDNA-mimic protein [Photorhabdus hindustanensis]PQQ28871.1 dsDNA-mimic protein [Photorhabdus hindustanensis]
MDLDINNRMTEDETLEKAYDIFLELASSNLDPADILLFSLQFEIRGGAELLPPPDEWVKYVDFDPNPDFFAEVIIGLAESEDAEINDVFARILICREKSHSIYHILWKD